MKNKKIQIIILVVGITLIIIGLSILIYSNIHEQNQNTKKKEETVLTSYNTFKGSTELFNTAWDKFQTAVSSDLFVESVEDDYDVWQESIKEYKKAVDLVENDSKELKKVCINNYYKNKDVQNKCDAFIIAYETTINYFVKDIDTYNQFIKEYKKDNDNKEVSEYVQDIYEYIDINEDGRFIGKD